MNTNTAWKGYTLQELRLQRIVTETKIELMKAKMLNDGNTLKKNAIPAPFTSPLLKKIMEALDYADYMILAFSVGRKIMRLFKRKKK